jgi:hypothetical protein
MDWALLALSAALVLTTVIYAVYTAKMSAEMRSTRLLGIRPRLALDVDVLAVHGILTITNVGQGAALGVDVALSFEPGGDSDRGRRSRYSQESKRASSPRRSSRATWSCLPSPNFRKRRRPFTCRAR